MNKFNKKGFTLIEMLVVIAIIAVLVSIIVPVVGNSTRKAAAAANAANLRSAAASIAVDVLNDTAKVDANGTITNISLKDIPEVKTNGGLGGGAFTYKMVDGQVVCTFGEGYTIEYYAKIAESGVIPTT